VVDGAEPVSRYAHDARWLFALPGVRVFAPWHAEDPVWLVLIITGHGSLQAMLPSIAPDPRMLGLHRSHKRSAAVPPHALTGQTVADAALAAVFKIASATSPSAVLSCTVGYLLVKQPQDHPVHIPRSCAPKLTRGA